MFDLIITNGEVVLPEYRARLDVGIRGEKIAALATPGSLGAKAPRVINARGLYLFPGGIDPHTHIQMEISGPPKPGFDVNSIAAAYGGTTTLIDFAQVPENKGAEESIDKRASEAAGKLAIDLALHVRFPSYTLAQAKKASPAIRYGVPSFGEISLDDRRIKPAEDSFLLAFFQELARFGGVAGMHAENASLTTYFTGKLLGEGKKGVRYFSESRPNIAEEESVRRTIYLAEKTGAAVYFFHLSARESIEAVASARKKGLPVYCETCPHYLAFNDSAYRQTQDKAIRFIRFPPIKSAADQAALWQGVIDGTIDCIGTDHVSAFLWEKREQSLGKSFHEMPGGMAQVENRLPFLFSEAVAAGKISAGRLVDIVSTKVAKIFGLYPRKGTIAPGSDADIVLFDPKARKKITSSELHMGMDYSIYEGWTFTGSVVMTLSRGKVIIEDGKYLGSLTDGRFLKRKISPDILKRFQP